MRALPRLLLEQLLPTLPQTLPQTLLGQSLLLLLSQQLK